MESRNTWHQFIDWWTVRKLGIILVLLALLIGIVGFLNQHGRLYLGEVLGQIIGDLYANVSTELASIALTALIIDYLNERRTDRQLQAQLIRELGGSDNGIALRAVRELKGHGWLDDGSLHKVHLGQANLQKANFHSAVLPEAYFYEANLEKANLFAAFLISANLQRTNLQGAFLFAAFLQDADLLGANMQGATLNEAQLQHAILIETDLKQARMPLTNLEGTYMVRVDLQGATGLEDSQLAQAATLLHSRMPDGKMYDGRYNLPVDLELAQKGVVLVKSHTFGYKSVDISNPAAIAEFYGVSAEEYLAGQAWANENLSNLRIVTSTDGLHYGDKKMRTDVLLRIREQMIEEILHRGA